MPKSNFVLYDGSGNPIKSSRAMKRSGSQAKALYSGFKGANDQNLADWAFLPLEINTILRNDLRKLRARSRDLARNDDTTRRFLALLKQNVLGHRGIVLQAKNRMQTSNDLDRKWNTEIEREWQLFGRKRRKRGQLVSPSACGQFSFLEIAWLSLMTRAVDGECFIQILKGYPHNPHRFAIRFLNPDLLDSTFCGESDKSGNRIEMGIEFDEFDRPVAYHFGVEHPTKKFGTSSKKRERIPADQIIHLFRKEHVGQIRGIPDFAAIMHKTKMLNGVHEAMVVGWRVAASKMGFFMAEDPEDFFDEDELDERRRDLAENSMDATPGSFELIPDGLDFKDFNPDYPSSTYGEGYKVFMRQLSNGLNVSSPTLSNDYSDVNYSSLRQALLEDREGWRCVQTEMAEGFCQPIFDEWYDWSVNVTRRVRIAESKTRLEPTIIWRARGWPWVDPLKEVKAQREAVDARFRTRQSVMSETSGDDFYDVTLEITEEESHMESIGLETVASTTATPSNKQNEDGDE